MSSDCNDCPVKKELLELATVMSRFMGDVQNFTVRRCIFYESEINEIIERLKPESEETSQ